MSTNEVSSLMFSFLDALGLLTIIRVFVIGIIAIGLFRYLMSRGS